MASENIQFLYDGIKAAEYADFWWDSNNPVYPFFKEADCTNYISQSLFTGGLPMNYTGNVNTGWWIRNSTWSYSWTVAHSLSWYLSSLQGKGTRLVNTPQELEIGDVISYDFNGDNHWDHNTIVTAKTPDGEPLVNAHTYNSYHRLWDYQTSPAYDPQKTRYLFWRITSNPPQMPWGQSPGTLEEMPPGIPPETEFPSGI